MFRLDESSKLYIGPVCTRMKTVTISFVCTVQKSTYGFDLYLSQIVQSRFGLYVLSKRYMLVCFVQ